jgi:hypothetical protein
VTGSRNEVHVATEFKTSSLALRIHLSLSASFKMPGTHRLPENLLKLFAPRPSLPYSRPLNRDPDRVAPKTVEGVGSLLAQLKEAQTASLLTSGEGTEEGEELKFTHAEEVKRQVRREERKRKRTEEFKIAKENCMYYLLLYVSGI